MSKTPEIGLPTETMKKRLVRLEGSIVDTTEAYSKVKKALCGNTNATLIEVLQKVDQLKSRLAQVERERDAAVTDLEDAGDCHYCKRKDLPKKCGHGQGYCSGCENKECPCYDCSPKNNNFKWRGVCVENTKVERSCVHGL